MSMNFDKKLTPDNLKAKNEKLENIKDILDPIGITEVSLIDRSLAFDSGLLDNTLDIRLDTSTIN